MTRDVCSWKYRYDDEKTGFVSHLLMERQNRILSLTKDRCNLLLVNCKSYQCVPYLLLAADGLSHIFKEFIFILKADEGLNTRMGISGTKGFLTSW